MEDDSLKLKAEQLKLKLAEERQQLSKNQLKKARKRLSRLYSKVRAAFAAPFRKALAQPRSCTADVAPFLNTAH